MDIQTDANRESIGYCIAYEADSETDSTSTEKCVYVADFGILPGYRNGIRTALYGLDQLLTKVKEQGHKKIEMEARESTSYRLLTSPIGQRILKARGFELSDIVILCIIMIIVSCWLYYPNKSEESNIKTPRLAAGDVFPPIHIRPGRLTLVHLVS